MYQRPDRAWRHRVFGGGQMVSMKDISKKVGVSVATVSKALNDHSDIGEATKIKV